MSSTSPSGEVIPAGSGQVGTSTVIYPADAKPVATLGYWSIRGLAQAIRYVLAYAGVPFADVRYQQGGAPDFSRQAWLDVKVSRWRTCAHSSARLPHLFRSQPSWLLDY